MGGIFVGGIFVGGIFLEPKKLQQGEMVSLRHTVPPVAAINPEILIKLSFHAVVGRIYVIAKK